MPFRVIVQGAKFRVASEAAQRGIPFVFVTEAVSTTAGDVPDAFLDDVERWFNERNGSAPHPDGTVLHYAGTERVPCTAM